MQIKESEHLIKKIENSELMPEEGVRKKLEKVLDIRLIDAPVTEAERKVQGKLTPTLGILRLSGRKKLKNNLFLKGSIIQAQFFACHFFHEVVTDVPERIPCSPDHRSLPETLTDSLCRIPILRR